MTRRLQPCRTCTPKPTRNPFTLKRGFTRHRDGRCSQCRRLGPPMPEGWPWGRAA